MRAPGAGVGIDSGERISGGRRARGASAPSQSAAAPLDARRTRDLHVLTEFTNLVKFITKHYLGIHLILHFYHLDDVRLHVPVLSLVFSCDLPCVPHAGRVNF